VEPRWPLPVGHRPKTWDSKSSLPKKFDLYAWRALHKAYGPLRSRTWLYYEEVGAGGAVERWQLIEDRANQVLEWLEESGEALRKESGPWIPPLSWSSK
jgi:hypothetical protein